MRKKKNNYSPEFKARVVMELLSGQKTLNELADQYQIAPATLSNWHKQFQERAAEVFQKGPSNKERELSERDQEIAVLQQKVGQLLIERDWLKKNLMKFSAPADRLKCVNPENKDLTVKRQSELLAVNRSSVYRKQHQDQDTDHGECFYRLIMSVDSRTIMTQSYRTS